MTDAEVRATAAAILLQWKEARDWPSWRQMCPFEAKKKHGWQNALANEFGRRMGWSWTRTAYSCSELKGKRRPIIDTGWPPYADHCSGYRIGRRPAAMVSQPYHTDAAAQSEMADWAVANGLVFLTPDFPSWWLPTRTMLFVFAAPGAMVKGQPDA